MKLTKNPATGLYEFPITEENVITEITARLTYAGVKLWRVRERIPTRTKRGNWCKKSTPGIPDLIGWIPHQKVSWGSMIKHPLPVFIECKRPGGARRAAQTRFIEEAKADGAIAFFADCWQDCREAFKAFGVDLPA